MHEDPGTCLAMEQHIASAGRHANSHRLANAVTEYWSILEESGESHNAKAGRERTARELFRRGGAVGPIKRKVSKRMTMSVKMWPTTEITSCPLQNWSQNL